MERDPKYSVYRDDPDFSRAESRHPWVEALGKELRLRGPRAFLDWVAQMGVIIRFQGYDAGHPVCSLCVGVDKDRDYRTLTTFEPSEHVKSVIDAYDLELGKMRLEFARLRRLGHECKDAAFNRNPFLSFFVPDRKDAVQAAETYLYELDILERTGKTQFVMARNYVSDHAAANDFLGSGMTDELWQFELRKVRDKSAALFERLAHIEEKFNKLKEEYKLKIG